MIKIDKTFFSIFPYLLVAAVILFGLFLGSWFYSGTSFQIPLSVRQAVAFLGEGNEEGKPLIVMESLKAEFEQIEKELLKEGSYVYSSGYRLLGQASDDEGFGGEELSGNVFIQGIALLSPNSPSTDNIGTFDRQRSGIVTYEVQTGDTPSYIAASFRVSTNTLLWANNLSYWSIIKPGQKLIILPTSGVVHEVKKGETLNQIVKKYKGDIDKTIAYNGLPANGDVYQGQKIVIPDGTNPVYYQPKIQYAYQTADYLGPYGNQSHRFPWGQCTWYVAQKRLIPWGGNANSWLNKAQQYGFQTGSEPVPGAIMATRESWYGHVAYVEAVDSDYVTVSEMHLGKGKLVTRRLSKDDPRIKGYIY